MVFEQSWKYESDDKQVVLSRNISMFVTLSLGMTGALNNCN